MTGRSRRNLSANRNPTAAPAHDLQWLLGHLGFGTRHQVARALPHDVGVYFNFTFHRKIALTFVRKLVFHELGVATRIDRLHAPKIILITNPKSPELFICPLSITSGIDRSPIGLGMVFFSLSNSCQTSSRYWASRSAMPARLSSLPNFLSWPATGPVNSQCRSFSVKQDPQHYEGHGNVEGERREVCALPFPVLQVQIEAQAGHKQRT